MYVSYTIIQCAGIPRERIPRKCADGYNILYSLCEFYCHNYCTIILLWHNAHCFVQPVFECMYAIRFKSRFPRYGAIWWKYRVAQNSVYYYYNIILCIASYCQITTTYNYHLLSYVTTVKRAISAMARSFVGAL